MNFYFTKIESRKLLNSAKTASADSRLEDYSLRRQIRFWEKNLHLLHKAAEEVPTTLHRFVCEDRQRAKTIVNAKLVSFALSLEGIEYSYMEELNKPHVFEYQPEGCKVRFLCFDEDELLALSPFHLFILLMMLLQVTKTQLFNLGRGNERFYLFRLMSERLPKKYEPGVANSPVWFL